MTKTLKTLIKMHKQFLDEKRRELVILEESREQIVRYITKLEIEFETEKQFTAKSPEKSYTFSDYAKLVKGKKEQAKARINALNKEIEALSDQIYVAFSEMKKYDIMKDMKEKKRAKELIDKAQINLDEIGGVAHRRRKESVQ